MFLEVNRLCPCLNPYAEAFYRTESLCFYWVDGEPVVIRSAEGSRMGCLLGCILFVIAVHRAFCAYAEESPISSMHGKTLAIVDDVNSTLRPPNEPHHHRDWLLKVLRSVEFLKMH